MPVSSPRRFSQAVSEGDGISLIAAVESADAARRAEADGAEALLVYSGLEGQLRTIREAVGAPILFFWDGEKTEALADADACVISVPDWQGGIGFGDALAQAHLELADDFELAFRIEDDEQLAESLERYDPEIFILAAPKLEAEAALERVLDLLPDVPAGKLAIAELSTSSREDVAALERAGMDGVIVRGADVGALAGEPAPDV
jgi:NAD(P)H-dependent flavin oxidoreductase YrpB (nitropropane dioxygenase family)